jgi:cell wall-associated NlpC family hydrolase
MSYIISGRAASIGLLAAVLAGSARTASGQVRPARDDNAAATAHASALHLVATRAVVHGVDIVRSAREFLGAPYRLGGTTPHAFDCSGFVRYVFALHGVLLPRTAHEQAAVGEAPLPGDSLEQGDLLFFWGGHGAQHIAIYMGGDSIIHASSTNHHVRIDRLTGGPRGHRTWFNQRLIAVRRVLPAQGVAYAPESVPKYSFIAGPNAEW